MTRHVTFMTIDDAAHYSPEERAAIVAAYPPHEREARAKGIPVLGSGRIFPVPEGHRLRADRTPEGVAAHRWHGFRLGSSLRGGRAGVGPRRRRGLRH